MADRSETVHVVDVPAQDRFVVQAEGMEAELVYRVRGDRLFLLHTEVPEALGGRGIAGQLVRASIRRAEADHLTIVPWCPYAAPLAEGAPGRGGRRHHRLHDAATGGVARRICSPS